jgi:predicted pyridoxine 5'-phosphate oxidase superfamily flavin-nucleotide-binding protein
MSNTDIVFTRAARRAQAERGSAGAYEKKAAAGFPNTVTPELAKFIAEQDTAFLGTASADGAPYIQHRGGPKGFIKVVDDHTLRFADYRGNPARTFTPRATCRRTTAPTCCLIDFSRPPAHKLGARPIVRTMTLSEKLFVHGYKRGPSGLSCSPSRPGT